jgi:hypothetical protein
MTIACHEFESVWVFYGSRVEERSYGILSN